ncbi:hypothetical protein Q8F57_003365 [Paraburkholderia terrae]|uniref:hypothetical protein n=1 Tax=Paraburkholderia terrae TaxID=311230 RepID=UPI00296B3DE5|nr:hypothetical protein [Paraburkholderia terrae]MDW3655435.1 hypothetical protein [Paraburkholderia terrae]
MKDPCSTNTSNVKRIGNPDQDAARGGARLYAIHTGGARRNDTRAKLRPLSYVNISVDAEGQLNYDSVMEPRHAERMVDALLLMLIKARQASA